VRYTRCVCVRVCVCVCVCVADLQLGDEVSALVRQLLSAQMGRHSLRVSE
jgi:hypothetical protein